MIRKSLHTIYSDDLERQFTISVKHENTYIVKTHSKKLGWQFCRMEIVEPKKPKTIILDENKILKRIEELEAGIVKLEKKMPSVELHEMVDLVGELNNLRGQRWALKNRKQFEV